MENTRLYRWNRSANSGWEFVKEVEEYSRTDEIDGYYHTLIPHAVDPNSVFNIWMKLNGEWVIVGWCTENTGFQGDGMRTLSQAELPMV